MLKVFNKKEDNEVKKYKIVFYSILVIVIILFLVIGSYIFYLSVFSCDNKEHIDVKYDDKLEVEHNNEKEDNVEEKNNVINDKDKEEILIYKEPVYDLSKMITNYLYVLADKVFVNEPNINNIEKELSSSDKMGVALFTMYGIDFLGSSICEDKNENVVVDVKSIPYVFNDNSFIDEYTNSKYLVPQENYELSNEYQDAGHYVKGGSLGAYMIKAENNKFYVRNRFCGAVGPQSLAKFNVLSFKEFDKEIVIKIKYYFVSPIINVDNPFDYFYWVSDRYTEDENELKNNALQKFNKDEEDFIIDFSKGRTYEIRFNKINNGFIIKNVSIV